MLTMHNRDIVLECRHLCKTIEGKKILHDVDFQLVRGSFLGLVGPSGSGKSTLLRAILGTHPACCGEVALHFGNGNGTTQIITNPNRHIGIVYQRYSLFDWLTARENVAFGPMLDLTSIPFRIFRPFAWRRMRKEHLKEAGELLEKLRLDKRAIDSLPAQLSGGMRQRVAIGQALTNKPLLLLLDEPFGALDEDTREGMQRIMLRLYAENIEAIDRGEEPPYTVILVTHELNEALLICDRVVALSQYWNWHEQGFDQCPGATIVYDKTTPVFQLEAERDFSIFASQRDEIRRVGFDPSTITRVDQFRQFWTQIQNGQGRRVLSNCNSAPKADASA